MTDTGDKKTTGFITLQTMSGESIVIENNDKVPDTYDRFKAFIMDKSGISLGADSTEALVIVSNGVVLDSTTYKKPNLTENEHYILLLVSKASLESEVEHQKLHFNAYGDNANDSDDEDNENDRIYTIKDLEITEEKVQFKDTDAGKFVAKLARMIVAEYPPLPEVRRDLIEQLMCIGLSEVRATNALLKNGMNVERAADYALTNFENASDEVLITPREYANSQGLGLRIYESESLVEHFMREMESKKIPLECVPFNVKVPMSGKGLGILDMVFSILKIKGFDKALSTECVCSAIRSFLEDPINFVPTEEQVEILYPYIEHVSKSIRLK